MKFYANNLNYSLHNYLEHWIARTCSLVLAARAGGLGLKPRPRQTK